MRKYHLFLIVGTLLIGEVTCLSAELQDNDIKVKTGYNFGVLPCVSFDPDKGFQYGALANIYDYGDGSSYPDYDHSLYVEASNTTKNCLSFRMFYDSEKLIPGYWVSADVSYLGDATFDFYGFNGYQSVYNSTWDGTLGEDNTDYFTRVFYKRRSDLVRAMADIRGTIDGNLFWNAGAGVLGYSIDDVNINSKLPQDQTELYRLYQEWGLIDKAETNGGWHPYLRAGLSYDSRNAVTNPGKGIWADAFLTYTAAFGGMSSYNNVKLNFDFRHYVTLIHDRLNLAYRVCTQNTIAGESPFYMDNYLNTLYQKRNIYDGLGGKNSLRGVMRNRILADGYAFATVELRSKLAFFDIGRQHFHLGLSPFVDAGMVTQACDIDESAVKAAFAANSKLPTSGTYRMVEQGCSIEDFFDFNADVYAPHVAVGTGFQVAMNENFVVNAEWAMPLNKQDNEKMVNIYLSIGYLF